MEDKCRRKRNEVSSTLEICSGPYINTAFIDEINNIRERAFILFYSEVAYYNICVKLTKDLIKAMYGVANSIKYRKLY